MQKKTSENNSSTKGGITYHAEATDFGVVAILKNNYSYTVDVDLTCVYYNNGVMVAKGKDSCYALEPGRECALRAWEADDAWNSYNITLGVEKATNIIGNASNIQCISNFGNENVMAEVRNVGKKNAYTNLAVVYYKDGRIVGYDDRYADVQNSGTVDYVEFRLPYGRDYKTIIPDSYKLYVNSSYTYTWMN